VSIETRLANRQDSWQRLQIGGAGLAGILLIAGITSLVLSNASDEPPLDPLLAEEQTQQNNITDTEPEDAPSEPLVDIGVVPDIAPDQSLGDPDEATSEDTVPDLPDPDQIDGDAEGQSAAETG